MLLMKSGIVYIDELSLVRPENTFRATLCHYYLVCTTNYDELIQHLHSRERKDYNALKFNKRIRSFLVGRLAAKQAVAALNGEKKLTSIFIESGVFSQPIVVCEKRNTQVSITHCEDYGMAIAFPEVHPMGIDLEKIDPLKRDVLAGQITAFENTLIVPAVIQYDVGLALLWTAKEALSKVLKTGLMTPFELFEVAKIKFCENFIICYYKNFPQYKAISFSIGNYMCSIVHPLKTDLGIDIQSLKNHYKDIGYATI